MSHSDEHAAQESRSRAHPSRMLMPVGAVGADIPVQRLWPNRQEEGSVHPSYDVKT
jgi:hypothetical protein